MAESTIESTESMRQMAESTIESTESKGFWGLRPGGMSQSEPLASPAGAR